LRKKQENKKQLAPKIWSKSSSVKARITTFYSLYETNSMKTEGSACITNIRCLHDRRL